MRRLLILSTAIMAVCSLVLVGTMWIRRAQHAARLSNAYGRLSQMRFGLEIYQDVNGTLPPLCLRDERGTPIQSWRVLILPQCEIAGLERLDLSQPWDSPHNREVIDAIPDLDWSYFARDSLTNRSPVYTHLFALQGPNSMWDADTGLPKGKMEEYPDAILLVSIPQSNTEPLEPGDLTEEEVRDLVEEGQEVLFVMAGVPHGYGIVTIENGKLAFHTWQEVLDRRDASP